MVCKNCGMANSDTAQVCSECGSVLRAEKPQPSQNEIPQAAEQPSASKPAATPAPPAYAAEPVYAWYVAPTSQPFYASMPFDMRFAQPLTYYAQVPSMQPTPAAAPATEPGAPVQPVAAEVVAQSQAEAAASEAQPEPNQAAAPQAVPQQPVNVHPFGEALPTTGSYSAAPVMTVPYLQAPVYQQQAYSPLQQKDPHAAKSTWALVLGILSVALPVLTCSLASPLGVICGLIAMIMGAVCLNKVQPENKGKTIAALILGVVGLVISALSAVLLIRTLSSVSFAEEFQNFYDQYTSFVSMIVFSGLKTVIGTISIILSDLATLIKIVF